jgi:uncharacterized protein
MGSRGFDADLFDAAEFGDLGWIQSLIGRTGVDGTPINIDAQDVTGRTILMLAAQYGYMEVVQFLLDQGADANLTDHQGETALMKAYRAGHLQVAEMLTNRAAKRS